MSRRQDSSQARTHGFTLLEVMIALVIVSIGLLGLAGMQLTTINNTNVARIRGLAAIQAASLAATMHANPGYWQSIAATITQSNVPAAGNCGSALCSAAQMAGYDVQTWQAALQANSLALPGGAGTFSCAPPTSTTPVICTISVTWLEKVTNAGGASLTTAQAYTTASYQLVMQP